MAITFDDMRYSSGAQRDRPNRLRRVLRRLFGAGRPRTAEFCAEIVRNPRLVHDVCKDAPLGLVENVTHPVLISLEDEIRRLR